MAHALIFAKLRALLRKAAACTYNDLRLKYQTMIQAGKPAKVALTALMRKLIEMANALVRQDREWTPKAA